ncbi:MAG: SRPBCC domain-containing protein [Armatimonadetes bacterium]|nr:SRPBCC domain-containing protein [Armatimonadota bacterium]NOG37966.1 SRPBCC domain-containing protein [Armatimonadota bacterium]GIK31854.1 MAG: hypothetical protein BroJett009_08460 [Armatimonadota bacterium]
MNHSLSSDFPITDESCKASTGKSLADWYAILDAEDALAKGRRAAVQFLHEQTKEPWWSTTLAVEYEKLRGVTKKDGLPEGYFICSTKTLGVPVDAAFRAWTDAQGWSEWLGKALSGEVAEGAAVEIVSGERLSFSRIRKNKDLRFTFECDGYSTPSQVEVQFQDKGGKTGLLVNHTRLQTRSDADSVRAAWSVALDSLKKLVESRES